MNKAQSLLSRFTTSTKLNKSSNLVSHDEQVFEFEHSQFLAVARPVPEFARAENKIGRLIHFVQTFNLEYLSLAWVREPIDMPKIELTFSVARPGRSQAQVFPKQA